MAVPHGGAARRSLARGRPAGSRPGERCDLLLRPARVAYCPERGALLRLCRDDLLRWVAACRALDELQRNAEPRLGIEVRVPAIPVRAEATPIHEQREAGLAGLCERGLHVGDVQPEVL